MGKKYQFKITVRPLAADLSETERDTSALTFNVGNHDDILQIVERMRGGALFDKDTAAAFAVGLKLFTEVMLEHRDDPLFAEIKPAIGELMKKLKSGAKSQADKPGA